MTDNQLNPDFADLKQIVRAGYNEIATAYTALRVAESRDVQLLNLLTERFSKRAMVLDAGCGSGHPVTEILAKSFQVTGVDFAEKQIRLARRRLPDVGFVCADLSRMPFKSQAFDAVCSYYAIIHIPREEHSKILSEFNRILRVGGLALLCLGAGDLPKEIADYHCTQMFWSHYDKDTNLEMMKKNGFQIIQSTTVEDPIDAFSSHLFVLGQKMKLN